jgi:ABC-2 type transport system permease protein
VTPDAVIVERAFASTDTSKKARLVAAVAISVGLQRGLEQAGVAPATAQRALSAPPLARQGILPRIPNRSSQRTTALYGSILLYVFLSFYGSWMLNGVVEEKTSRVVEVLLAAMRPRQLLVGKVIGIGLVALAQGVLVVLVALGSSAAIGSNFLRGTNVSLLLLTLMWFLLGYGFYATLYAAAGSLVTRQEEAQAAAFRSPCRCWSPTSLPSGRSGPTRPTAFSPCCRICLQRRPSPCRCGWLWGRPGPSMC